VRLWKERPTYAKCMKEIMYWEFEGNSRKKLSFISRLHKSSCQVLNPVPLWRW
jgi:hypothetical protein